MAVQKEPRRPVDYGSSEAANGLSVFSEQFDSQFAYNGDDLGCHYEHAQTRFVLWAPTAEEAFVMLYEDDQDTEGRALPMLKEERGIWRAAADADLEGWSYTYRVRIGQQWNEAVDPYARAVRINGTRVLSSTWRRRILPAGSMMHGPLLSTHLMLLFMRSIFATLPFSQRAVHTIEAPS